MLIFHQFHIHFRDGRGFAKKNVVADFSTIYSKHVQTNALYIVIINFRSQIL